MTILRFWAVSACNRSRSVAKTRADSAVSRVFEGVALDGSDCGTVKDCTSSRGRFPWLAGRDRRKRGSSSAANRGVGAGGEMWSSAGFITKSKASSCSSSLSSKFQNCFSASHHSTTRLRLATARSTCTYQLRPCQSGWSSHALPMACTLCTMASTIFGCEVRYVIDISMTSVATDMSS